MIQKKICMVGMFGTGKTSLVKQFIYSKFSEKYHSTIGVKVDRKQISIDDQTVTLLIWDLAGKDAFSDIRTSYLKGSSGVFLVADGTRRETYDELFDLQKRTEDTIGDVPSVVALNKADLVDEWQLTQSDYDQLAGRSWNVLQTSAKTGNGVEEAFHWLAKAMVTS